MFPVNRKLKLTCKLIIFLSLAITIPVLASNLIGSIFPISVDKSLRELNPATAYNPDLEEYLVVWHNDLSSGFDNIQAQRLDKNGVKIGEPITISKGEEHARNYPDVAFSTKHKQYLVVWQDTDLNRNWLSIQGRRLSGTGSVIETFDILISEYDFNRNAFKPAVAYNSESDQYMVVWAEKQLSPVSYDIYAKKFTYDVNNDGLTTVSQSPYSQTEPDIAYNQSTSRFLVVWQQLTGTGVVFTIKGCQVYGDGGIYATEFDIEDKPNNAYYPAVDAIANSPGNINFLVVYQYDYSPTNYDIHGVFIEKNGTIAITLPLAESTNKERMPSVAGSESAGEYLVVWREDAGPGDTPLKAKYFDSNGMYLGGPYTINGLACSNGVISAGPQKDFLIAWNDVSISDPDPDIFGMLFGDRNQPGYRVYVPLIRN